MDRVLRRCCSSSRRSRRRLMPGLMPPPAIQMREAAAVVVAAVVVLGQRALAVDRAAELAAPDDQRVVEQAALLEVLDQRGRRAGRRPCTGRGSGSGRLPCWSQPRWIELDEPHAALGHPAGEQAVAGEAAVGVRRRRCRTCRASASARSDRSVSSGTLVCMRKAISYWAMRVLISGSPNACGRELVELADAVEHRRGGCRRRCPAGWTGTAPGRRRSGSATPWCCARQEAAAPQAREDRLVGLVAAALRDHARRTPAGSRSRCPGRSSATPRGSAGPAAGCRSG